MNKRSESVKEDEILANDEIPKYIQQKSIEIVMRLGHFNKNPPLFHNLINKENVRFLYRNV